MDEPGAYNPSTVEEVARDFRSRRNAMAKALTTEVECFFQECDPDKENLCLYGFPNETWKVSLPAEEVPPELPEPALGINFARDGMDRKDWLSLVAVHSDAWLIAVAFYYGARLESAEKRRLFDMINDQPTLFELVTGRKEKSSSKNKKKEAPKRPPPPKKEEDEEDYEDEEDDEHGDTYCGSCAQPYNESQFWIACDICQKWYHGACVKMTAAKAANVEEYQCPACNNNNNNSNNNNSSKKARI